MHKIIVKVGDFKKILWFFFMKTRISNSLCINIDADILFKSNTYITKKNSNNI